MSPRIVSKAEYEALKITATRLHDNDSIHFLFPDFFNIYITDIVRKVQSLKLDITITTTVNSNEYKNRLYNEIMAVAKNKFEQTTIKKKPYKKENKQYSSQEILQLWKQFVLAYIQKCYFFGIVPDKTHLEFLQPQKKKTLETKPRKFLKKRGKGFVTL